MNFLRQGLRKLSYTDIQTDRQTYATEIIYHAALRVVNDKNFWIQIWRFLSFIDAQNLINRFCPICKISWKFIHNFQSNSSNRRTTVRQQCLTPLQKWVVTVECFKFNVLFVLGSSNSRRTGQLEAQLRHSQFEHHRQPQLVASWSGLRRQRLPRRLGTRVPSTRSHHGQDHRTHQGPAQGMTIWQCWIWQSLTSYCQL